MDSDMVLPELPNAKPPREQRQGSRESPSKAWNSHKEAIYRFYILGNNTLETTMQTFEKEYGLDAW
jgi:hypothetical protein